MLTEIIEVGQLGVRAGEKVGVKVMLYHYNLWTIKKC